MALNIPTQREVEESRSKKSLGRSAADFINRPELDRKPATQSGVVSGSKDAMMDVLRQQVKTIESGPPKPDLRLEAAEPPNKWSEMQEAIVRVQDDLTNHIKNHPSGDLGSGFKVLSDAVSALEKRLADFENEVFTRLTELEAEPIVQKTTNQIMEEAASLGPPPNKKKSSRADYMKDYRKKKAKQSASSDTPSTKPVNDDGIPDF